MKAFTFFTLLLFTLCFSGCIDVNEEVKINRNGSGELMVTTDMSQLIDMLQTFVPPDELSKADFGRARDTIIKMSSWTDTATNLTNEAKALFKNGTMHLQMNMAEKKFNMQLAVPFQKLEDVPKIYQNMNAAGGGMQELMKGLGDNEAGGMPTPELKQPGSFYDIETGKRSISRILNKERFATVMKDSMMQQMKQMGDLSSMFGEMKMNTTIKLPSKAKKMSGTKAELSSDGKTVLVKANLMDMIEHPEAYEFSVTY
jgi:hypothetical protein